MEVHNIYKYECSKHYEIFKMIMINGNDTQNIDKNMTILLEPL